MLYRAPVTQGERESHLTEMRARWDQAGAVLVHRASHLHRQMLQLMEVMVATLAEEASKVEVIGERHTET